MLVCTWACFTIFCAAPTKEKLEELQEQQRELEQEKEQLKIQMDQLKAEIARKEEVMGRRKQQEALSWEIRSSPVTSFGGLFGVPRCHETAGNKEKQGEKDKENEKEET